ncbi:uncharacterized protein [Musca autumnalis]|uniref:uncharacterized protein n=1 Tax=Musca autumnalis TaxID=221902 RepID=UPI003CFAE36A
MIEPMIDNMEYIKCGEVLLSPSLDCKDQYILKCIECEDCYTDLDMLVEHCLVHYQQNIAELEKSSVSALIDDMFDGDGNDDIGGVPEKVTIKYELLSEVEPDEMDTISVIDIAEEYLDEKLETLNCSKEEPEEEESEEKETDENQGDEECMLEMGESGDECQEDGEDSKTSIFVRNFMSIKLNVTTIIAAYKKQPYLWNSNNPPDVRAKERPKCLQKIADEIKDRINVQVTSKEVAAVIARLRHDYRERLKKANEFGAENKMKNTRSWFYEQMDFLQPYMENCSIYNLDSNQTPLEIDQIIQIFGIYKRLPVLWNCELIENVCTNKRADALQQMQKMIDSEMGIKVNINNIKRYLHTIHAFFTKEKRNSTTNFRTTKERFDLYKHLVFLTDHVGPFKCTECNRSFLSPLNWKVHMAEHDGTIPLICSLCKKEYKTTDAYMAHARRHMNDLRYECKECGKKFSRPADLEIHLRCHTGIKPYCCEICGASYRHSQAFKTHKRRHQKQYLHHCPVCSKGFYKKDQLNNHVRTHTDIRDIKCDVCDKGFKTKKTMLQHKLTHEEGRNHMCPFCDKTFKNKLGLSQHVKIHRKNDIMELEIN